MTISQFWTPGTSHDWLSQATPAGGQWPSYLQGLHSLPSSLGFSRVGCCCTKEGWVKSHTQPCGSQNEGLSDPTQEAGTGERPAQQKKAPHPFTSLSTVQTSSVLLSRPHVTPASCQKYIFLLKGNILHSGIDFATTFLLYMSFFLRHKKICMPSIYVKYFKTILHKPRIKYN